MFTKSLILTAVLAFASFSAVAADHIDIKGFHLGVMKIEADALKRQYAPIFTIGGVNIIVDDVTPFFHFDGNGNADTMLITLTNNSFDQIKDAVLTKYPSTKCVDSVVSNAMNAQFQQTICTYKTDTEILSVNRIVDIGQMGIFLQSVASLKAEEVATAKAKNDL